MVTTTRRLTDGEEEVVGGFGSKIGLRVGPKGLLGQTIKHRFVADDRGRWAGSINARRPGGLPEPNRMTRMTYPLRVSLLTAACCIALSAYGQDHLGPSFDCRTRAVQDQPLAQAICSDRTLARNELGYVVAYQAVFQSLKSEADKRSLREAANAFPGRIADACGLARAGQLKHALSPQTLDCLNGQFLRGRDALVSRLTGPARVEAELSPQDAIDVQRLLRDPGHLPSNAAIDGVYGPATRTAIVAWQQAAGVTVTGFASREMLAQKNRTSGPQAAQAGVSPDQPVTFGSCRDADMISQYSAQAFLRESPILGVPPAQWTNGVLDSALKWARGCFEAARSRGNVVPPRGTVERWLSGFADNATRGMALRRAKDEAPRLQEEAARALLQSMNEEIPLSGGGSISCTALGRYQRAPERLDALLFGQSLRVFTPTDFQTIQKKLAECDALNPAARSSMVERIFPKTWIHYYPERRGLRALADHVDKLRAEEAHELAMRDPAKRAEYEARQRERRFSVQEAQIRSDLDGKPQRRPTSSASDQVMFCGGYFTLQRAIDALIRADLTPSADDSALHALGFQMLAQTWLANRQGVLGDATVQSELLPVFRAGLSAGLSADVGNVKPVYRACLAAADALGRERAKLK